VSAVTSGDEQVARAPAPHGLAGPADTTTRFALLVMAVITTSALIFLDIYSAVPSNHVRLANAQAVCKRQLLDGLSGVGQANAGGRALLLARFRQCLVPANLAWDTWAGYGILFVFTLAAVLYGLHPWRKINDWQIRGWRLVRRRAHPLAIDSDPVLAAVLAELSGEAGLSRPPVWLVSYPEETGKTGRTGAAAFGLPWRRYVRLDTGLVILRTTNLEGVRATIRHELAHLSSRDVDKTFATFAIWQAFTVVALVPFLAFTLQPRLLSDPSDWSAGAVLGNLSEIVAVLALTLLVYLTRSSILRLRELHADATAAALGGSSAAMRARLEASRKPPLTDGRDHRPAWLKRHPDRGRRVAVLHNPSILASPSWWELAGVGVAAGVLAANAGFALNQLILASLLGPALGGVFGAVPAIGLLAATLWRATTGNGTGSLRRPGIWMVMPPAAVAAGFCVGEPLAFINSVGAGNYISDSSAAASLAAMAFLTAGGLLLTCWIVAAIWAVAAMPGPRRRSAFRVVAGSAVMAATPWFAVWFGFWYIKSSLLAPSLGFPPDIGGFIGWYRLWAQWSGLNWPPLQWLNAIPLALPGLTLLWLVPLALTARCRARGLRSSRSRIPMWPALGPALVGAGAAAGINIALACVAKAALPVTVRQVPAPGVFFDSVYANTEIVVAVLVEAAVAGVVVARARQYRIPLALLAVTATAALNAVSIPLVSDSIAKCMDVFGDKPAGYPAFSLRCVRVPPVLDSALTLHQLTTEGLIAAVPAALLAFAFTALRRHPVPVSTGAGSGAAGPQETASPGYCLVPRVLTAVTLTLLLAVTSASAIVLLPHDWTVWRG
jgi:Zn-dependent protease with chaperone function